MRKAKWICPVLCLIFLAGCFGCSSEKSKAEFQPGDNLISFGTTQIEGGELKKSGFSGEKGTVYTVEFPKPQTINTVILREKGSNVSGFIIEARQNGVFKKIYEQDDGVGAYRYCAFPRVTADALRIVILNSLSAVEISSVEVYDVAPKSSEDFRVTTYITVDQAYHAETLQKQSGSLEIITDIIFFGSARFNENGEVWLNDVTINGQQIDGEIAFRTALENIKALIGNRGINLYCNFIGPDAPANAEDAAKAKCDLHNMALNDHQDTLIENLMQFTGENGFTGIFFDYEYPTRLKDWRNYSNFLEALRAKNNGQYKIGAAMPAWKHVAIPKTMKPLDLVEIMGYDLFDERGYHATFPETASNLIGAYAGMGADMNKVDLGMPFYARPIDGESFWFDYSWEAEKLGRYHNIATGPQAALDWNDGGKQKTRDVPRYYNGYQMIYDKTAYAIDSGAGGVMTWNYGYDLPYENDLALFRAVKQAIEDRTTSF